MRRIEVSCIVKVDKNNIHEKISHIGGTYKDTYWKIPIEEAIHNIENGFFAYFVNKDGVETDIIVAVHDSEKYLKTKIDGTEKNNLLSLGQCSAMHK